MPKTSDLPAASPLDGTETFPAVQGGVSKKATTGSLVLGANGITKIVALTQTAYDALGVKDATTLYVIVP